MRPLFCVELFVQIRVSRRWISAHWWHVNSWRTSLSMAISYKIKQRIKYDHNENTEYIMQSSERGDHADPSIDAEPVLHRRRLYWGAFCAVSTVAKEGCQKLCLRPGIPYSNPGSSPNTPARALRYLRGRVLGVSSHEMSSGSPISRQAVIKVPYVIT